MKAVAGSLDARTRTLDDEQLVTLLCLVESIINSRPITNNPDDPRDGEALTPNHLLLLRGGPRALGTFKANDIYGKRWRHVQSLASQFWKRWLREYLPTLQMRQKWETRSRNFAVDDIVLLVGETTQRSQWPLARVVEAVKGSDGLVRTLKLLTQGKLVARPVTKVVLLEGAGDN